jgi:mycothiol synthase
VHRISVSSRLDADARSPVTDLLAAAEAADGERALDDHMWLDLCDGGRPGFAAITAVDTDGNLAAYGQVSLGNQSWLIDLVVHPDHRRSDEQIEHLAGHILHAGADTIRHAGGGHVHWWVSRSTAIHERLAATIALHPGRELLQMRCALPLVAEVRGRDVPTRAFVPGRDEQAWLVVNNRAFAAHPEQGGWTLDTLQLRESEPWFDAAVFRLHEIDGRLAAFCWTKRHDAAEPMGEIYAIAVDPDFHGRGLGRALTVAGLDAIAAQGLGTAMLYVDGANAAAVGLYRSLGFTVHHTNRAFVGDL